LARTVLLADDSVTAQNMGRRILMDAGYDVITVNNGSAALKKIHENQPDLIVLDVYMPGYGGLEVCQRLKESSETMRIPVLLTVGKMEPFKSDEAKRVRADGHIVKPFEASELLAALTKLEDRIVPQAEPARARKKSEKRARFWHAADPATTFDDSHTEKIAYLSEVKDRQSRSDVVVDAPTETEAITEPSGPVQSTPESSLVPQTAEELPVIAEDAVSPQSFAVEAAESQSYAAEKEGTGEPIAPAQEQLTDNKIEIADAAPDAPHAESATASLAAPEPPAQVDSKAAPRWIAENVPLTAEEASLALDQEMLQAQARAAASNPVSSDATPAESAAENTPAPSPEKNGATFAAAAAASSASVTGSSTTSEHEPDRAMASEAAAAWQNWQQIRESVMSAQSTDAIAEAVATIASDVPQQATESAQRSSEAAAPSFSNGGAAMPVSSEDSQANTEQAKSPASPLEGEALAGIIDSVLAELKPKLMEEISKKLKK
jgi:CheY-like chemotaxis protein